MVCVLGWFLLSPFLNDCGGGGGGDEDAGLKTISVTHPCLLTIGIPLPPSKVLHAQRVKTWGFCVCVLGGGGGGWKQDFVFFHFPLQALSNTTVGVVSSFAGPSEDGGRWMFPRQHWSDQIGSVANSGLQVYYVRAISANACAFCSSGGGGGGGGFWLSDIYFLHHHHHHLFFFF